MAWRGSIFETREGRDETPEETSDGNYEYSNGTYGQSDYTVRERCDGSGLSDVYIDNGTRHSHDVIDEEGNIVESYHDYIMSRLSSLSLEELKQIRDITYEELVNSLGASLKLTK